MRHGIYIWYLNYQLSVCHGSLRSLVPFYTQTQHISSWFCKLLDASTSYVLAKKLYFSHRMGSFRFLLYSPQPWLEVGVSLLQLWTPVSFRWILPLIWNNMCKAYNEKTLFSFLAPSQSFRSDRYILDLMLYYAILVFYVLKKCIS